MKSGLTALCAAALLAGCGSDDDDSAGGGPETSAPDVAVFKSDSVGFTFEYPSGFARQEQPADQILGQVSVEPGAALNAIKLRKTADQELGTERYLDEFQSDFAATVGEVDKREETVGELEVGVLEFTDSIERAGENVEFTSRSYFFTGGGKTWQIECIADAEHQDEIDAACTQALETVDFGA